ncbi:MAG: trypsin-like serine protease [Rhizobiales bacterium]|nr:trypsin-like serine protease [Hyphomicrobiales bacterium]
MHARALPFPARPLLRLMLVLAVLAALPAPARAIVGGGAAPAEIAARTVMIVSTRGASCTGTVLARDLLLTAAHCVAPKADYAVALVGQGPVQLIPIARVAVHSGFNAEQFRTRRPTPDLALARLAEPLPERFVPARLSSDTGLPPRGATFLIAGFGMIADGAEKTAGTLRAVTLASIGTTGGIMVRLSAPEGNAGACTGDSGGPAFADGEVAGVIGWVTAAGGARGCGGVTGITLVGLQRDWIARAARELGRPLAE